MHINQLRLLYFLIVTVIMISSVIYAKPRLLHNGFLALMEWVNVIYGQCCSFLQLSWTFEKQGTKLEWRWKCQPSSNNKQTTAEILDFLMDANIRLSVRAVILKCCVLAFFFLSNLDPCVQFLVFNIWKFTYIVY